MADERDGRTSSFGQDPLLDLLTRAVLLLCCLPIAPALLGGFALAQWLRRRDERLLALTSLVSIMGGAVLALLFHPTAAVLALAEQVAYQVHHAWQWARLLQALVPLWAMSLLLLPSCGLLLLLFRPIPIEERALAHMRHEEARLGRVRTRAKKHVRRGTPDEQEGQGVLGAWVDGDLGWRKKQWLVFPTRELGQHGVIIGASGTGKTETLLRLAVLAEDARLAGDLHRRERGCADRDPFCGRYAAGGCRAREVFSRRVLQWLGGGHRRPPQSPAGHRGLQRKRLLPRDRRESRVPGAGGGTGVADEQRGVFATAAHGFAPPLL